MEKMLCIMSYTHEVELIQIFRFPCYVKMSWNVALDRL